MKLVSVILVIACLVELFDSSTANAVKSCKNDTECVKNKLDFCINNKCYLKVKYGSRCNYTRQCYRPKQGCFNSTCKCTSGAKWEKPDCVSTAWNVGEISGTTVGVLLVLVVLVGVVEIIRRRQRG